MRRSITAWILTAVIAGTLAHGQDDARPDQLQNRYNDALVQLKQAQDRKNELATQLVDLQKQLDAARSHNDELTRQANDFADRTFFLRSHYAAWTAFIKLDAKLAERWKFYVSGGTLPGNTPEWTGTNEQFK